MHTFLHKKLIYNLKKHLNYKDNLLIAISGGQDSLCLIKLLIDCLNNKNYRLEAIYIDYQWQNNSIKHTKQLIHLTKKLAIKLSIYQIKSLTFSEKYARELRYQILIDHAIKYNFSKILLGHNKNDKIETFLHKLFRGTSIEGAIGLVWKRKITSRIYIIRPMLNFTKAEIEWFCRKFNLPIWSDITNYNYLITRNRLRYELIPYLKQYLNLNVIDSIYSFLDLSQVDNDYIKENTIRLYLKIKHHQLVSLNMNLLKQEHITLQKRSLQLFFQYNFNISIKQKTITNIINYSENKVSNILQTNNLVIQYKNNWLYANFIAHKKIQISH